VTALITESPYGELLRMRAPQDARYLLMLQAYFDDSGTHGGPHCFLAGYLAAREQWAGFADQWDELRRKYLGGRPLKMAAANREKNPGYVPVEGLLEFASCIVEHVEFEVWAALPEYYAQEIQVKYGVKFDRYQTCFLGVIEAVANDYRIRALNDRVEWVFDHQGRGGIPPDEASALELALHRAFNNARSVAPDNLRPLLADLSFKDDDFTSPLQAADFLAWHKRRFQATGIDDPTHAAYEILREAPLKRIEVIWFDHKLEDLLDRITKPNHSETRADPEETSN
jgi:hypothetical protein